MLAECPLWAANSGKHLLTASFSGFDPDWTLIGRALSYLLKIYAGANMGLRTSKNADAATMQRAPASRNAGP